MENLSIRERSNNINNSAKKLRREGKVPGVLYGALRSNFLFEVGELELNKEIVTNGEYGMLNVNVEGEEKKVIIKEVQRDPVYNNIIHIDLEEVSNKEVQTEVPVRYLNEKFITKNGGVLQKEKPSIKIKCSSDKIPSYVSINLKQDDIGSAIKISDVEFGSEISVLDDLNTVIASISYSIRDALLMEEEE